ncbi:DNA polymerase III subunit gamma/tau [Moritella sp. F3]|uniref:DNA polymerase III subunit gamma/tau n=1 Tax=Moritella sp. F3 TaxID=2718882 RepID=UPI0018E17EE2|nr:DNA polymerase III subunit gamma/tau [Moritella sp. F3]GIC79307.1 DNA polymerase III subunit gamma/tau [Moritella sp. F1]GIC81971.1 DNA polymerase III subunit gamma/tau [Moritella sp. F3]
MSYQVLARKWRPHNFQQVVGQQHVLTALVNALEQDRLHHAYLLSGTRGVGKTTIARILAKSLNCEKGITSKPCGECSTCVEIDQGSYVDLLEIDAASRTKVEDTRELLDNVQYKPARGRFKVYLIDEVHMLSKHSFNALLKTLEEPPEYVKFLLATTDPQKLPITILSRCLQFHLKVLTPEQISQQLVHILSREHCQYELSALNSIAKAADGSMRDALSLTDQALSHGAGEVLHQTVLDMLGTLDHSHMLQLLRLIVTGDANSCMAKIAEVSSLGPDFDQLHIELASLLHRIAMAQILPSSVVDSEHADKVKALCDEMSPEDVQLYYQITLTGRKELPLAPDPRSALEMTILRMLAFRPQGRLQAPERDVTPAPVTIAPVMAETVVAAPVAQAPVSEVLEAAPIQAQVSAPELAPLQQQAPQQIQQLEPQQQVQPVAVPALEQPDDAVMNLNLEQNELLQAAQAMGHFELQTAEQQIAEPQTAEPQHYAVPQNSVTPEYAPQPMNNVPVQVAPIQQEQVSTAPASQQQPLKSQEQVPAQAAVPESGVDQGRKTRNFLRSRLGTTAKKSTAAKSEQAPSSYVPPKKAVAPVIQHTPASQSRFNTPASQSMQQQQTQQQSPPTWDELPPLDSYQDQGNYPDQGQYQDSGPAHYQGNAQNQGQGGYNNQMPAQGFAEPAVRQIDRFSQVKVDINDLSPAFQPQKSGKSTATAPLDNKLRDENDPWCCYINQMSLGGRVRQLALHSVMEQEPGRITLTMNPDQRYFANDKSRQQLSDALQQVLSEPVELVINFGENPNKSTPAQLEEIIYQQRLANATKNLYDDKYIQFFMNRLGAVIDDSSIVPL